MYFVLVPETDPNTTILTPVENADKIGLREIISADEADEILDYMTDAEVEWVSDHKKRKLAYETALRSGDLLMLAKMIKELLLQEAVSPLSNCDKEILPKAQKKLFSEIALAKGMDFDDALRLVDHAILA